MKRNIFFAILGAAVLWGMLWYQRQFRTYESTALADVTWTVGGEACVIDAAVARERRQRRAPQAVNEGRHSCDHAGPD